MRKQQQNLAREGIRSEDRFWLGNLPRISMQVMKTILSFQIVIAKRGRRAAKAHVGHVRPTFGHGTVEPSVRSSTSTPERPLPVGLVEWLQFWQRFSRMFSHAVGSLSSYYNVWNIFLLQSMTHMRKSIFEFNETKRIRTMTHFNKFIISNA